MKTCLLSLLSLLLIALLVWPAASFASADSSSEAGYAPDELIVKFKPGLKGDEKRNIHAKMNAQERASIDELGVSVVKIPKGQTPKGAADSYKKNPNIEYVEPNYEGVFDIDPDDTYYGSRQPQLTLLNASEGWDILTGGGPIVAIVDSGIASHPDLPALESGYNFIDNNAGAGDTQGHGTQVAGILGAKGNNKTGIAGVNWNARIMPVKITNTTSVYAASVAQGIIYAAKNGAKVINLSLGFTTDSAVLRDAVNYAYNEGCVIVAASGNNGASSLHYPARYDNVLAVGATGDGASRYSSSNYGAGLDVVACHTFYTTTSSGAYASAAGTSIAAPQVAALASLLLELKPGASPSEIYQLIRNGAKDIGAPGFDQETGYGLIDIGKTLAQVAKASPSPTPTSTPTPTPAASATPEPTEDLAMPASEEDAMPAGAAPGDASGADATPPVIALNGPVTMVLTRTQAYNEPGAKATDNVDGDLTSSILIEGDVDTMSEGQYTLAYTVQDAAGNRATAKRVVTVNEPETVVERPSKTFRGDVGAKASSALSFALSAQADGDIDVKVSFSGNKVAVEAAIVDAGGRVVKSAQGASSFAMNVTGVTAGDYSLVLKPVGSFNKLGVIADVLMPEIRYMVVDDEKIPYGVLLSQNTWVLWGAGGIMLVSVVITYLATRWWYTRRAKTQKVR